MGGLLGHLLWKAGEGNRAEHVLSIDGIDTFVDICHFEKGRGRAARLTGRLDTLQKKVKHLHRAMTLAH